jgi:hypothetical protein
MGQSHLKAHPNPPIGKLFTDLPPELKEAVFRHATQPTLNALRGVNKEFRDLANLAPNSLTITSRGDLARALEVFKSGGIQKLTLQGQFTDADLAQLPATLLHLAVRRCEDLTDAALQAVRDRGVQVIR